MFENTPLFAMLGLVYFSVLLSFFRGSKFVTSTILFVFSFLYLLYSSGRIGGVDTPFYRKVFGTEACGIFEYGFQQLCRLDSPSGFSFIFLVSSILLLFSIYRSCENYRVMAISCLIMFPSYFVIVDMGYLRQSIAASLLIIFCFNQENKKIRFIGYVIALFFHISSFILIFFLELYYSKKMNIAVVVAGGILGTIAVAMFNKFTEGGIAGLLTAKLSLNSIVQLIFLLLLNVIASIQFKWRARVTLFVTVVCVVGYFGHFFRVYLYLFPIVAFGVAGFLVEKKLNTRVFVTSILMVFGFFKLSATVYNFDGAFDIPYSENMLLWFL